MIPKNLKECGQQNLTLLPLPIIKLYEYSKSSASGNLMKDTGSYKWIQNDANGTVETESINCTEWWEKL